jgi:GTP pyrophosphokinase
MKSPIRTEEEKRRIKKQLDELIADMNCSEEGENLIRKAFEFANNAHDGVRRKSGELYIFHPLAVASIVVKIMELDENAVCAALLHDVVEDTNSTVSDIRFSFNPKIADLVEGLTKISVMVDRTGSKQAENFRKILLTLSTDETTILIKIADRLHNMRTLDSMTERKQFKIASETFFLYAPLAERLGFYEIKSELEDLSLKYREPAAYEDIRKKIEQKELEDESFIKTFVEPIGQKLKEAEVEYHVDSRFKSVYSIWNKIQNKHIPFEEIYDLFAIRIVFTPKKGLPERTQCWFIYSMITEIYRPKLDRLRDWVGTPKANGYEALHCTVMGTGGIWVEVQIRTERMNEIAEKGIAAHRKYKKDADLKDEFDNWMQQIRESFANSEENAEEFVDRFKNNLLYSEIYVFTPKGEQLMLPKGATALDFAYAVHSEVGHHAAAAKVNSTFRPLSYVLKSADQVEIITVKTQKPKKEWLEYVFTPKARSLIKATLRSDIKDHGKKGKNVIDLKLEELGIQPGARTYNKLASAYGQHNTEELFSNVGAGLLELENFNKILRENTPTKIVRYLGIGLKKKKKTSDTTNEQSSGKINPRQTYILAEDNKLSYKIAECCKPIPGDEIITFLDENTESSVIVHKKKCIVATQLAAKHGDRIVDAQWNVHKILSFLAVLEMRGIDRIGILKELTDIVATQLNVNTRKLNIESHDGIFEGYMELYVHDLDDLNILIEKVQTIKGMYHVQRAEKSEV